MSAREFQQLSQKNKPKVDYEPRSAHGRAVNYCFNYFWIKWTFGKVIKSKTDLSWHLGIDNPWQKRDLWKVAFKEASVFSWFHWPKCGCSFCIKWMNSANMKPIYDIAGWRPRPCKGSAFVISFLWTKAKPHEIKTSFRVIMCWGAFVSANTFKIFPVSFRVDKCFDFVIERAGENAWIVFFLWSHNPPIQSWRKDVVVMFTITRLRLFVQLFSERTVLVNQVGWAFLLRSVIAAVVSSSTYEKQFILERIHDCDDVMISVTALLSVPGNLTFLMSLKRIIPGTTYFSISFAAYLEWSVRSSFRLTIYWQTLKRQGYKGLLMQNFFSWPDTT